MKRITRKVNGEIIKTNAFIITFERTTIPSEIKVAYHRVKVRQYMPYPMRCFKCQRFGHITKYCKSKSACSQCSSEDHIDKECSSDERLCMNCKGQRPSYSSACPKYNEEKEIRALKIRNNVTFGEARKAYRAAHPTKGTYTSAVKSSSGISIQSSYS